MQHVLDDDDDDDEDDGDEDGDEEDEGERSMIKAMRVREGHCVVTCR